MTIENRSMILDVNGLDREDSDFRIACVEDFAATQEYITPETYVQSKV